jgi:hypothetical protein
MGCRPTCYKKNRTSAAVQLMLNLPTGEAAAWVAAAAHHGGAPARRGSHLVALNLPQLALQQQLQSMEMCGRVGVAYAAVQATTPVDHPRAYRCCSNAQPSICTAMPAPHLAVIQAMHWQPCTSPAGAAVPCRSEHQHSARQQQQARQQLRGAGSAVGVVSA